MPENTIEPTSGPDLDSDSGTVEPETRVLKQESVNLIRPAFKLEAQIGPTD